MANFTQDRMYEMLGEISKKQKRTYKKGGLTEADCPFGYSLVNGECVPDPDCEDGQCRETDEIQAIYDKADSIPNRVVDFEKGVVERAKQTGTDTQYPDARKIWREEGIKSFVEPSCMYIAGLGYRCAPETEDYFKKFNPVHFNSNIGFIHAVDRGDVPFKRTGKFSDRNFDALEKGNVQVGDIVNFKGADNSHAMTFIGYTDDGHPKYIDSNGSPVDYGIGSVWKNLRPNTVGLGPDHAYVNRFDTERYVQDTYGKQVSELEKQARENPTFYKQGGLTKYAEGGEPCPDGHIKNQDGNCISQKEYNAQIAQSQIDTAEDFTRKYFESPMYNEMLKTSAGDKYESIKQGRDENLENLSDVRYKDKFLANGVVGYSDASSGKITLGKDALKSKGVAVHELAHSTDAPVNFFDKLFLAKKRRLIPESDNQLIEGMVNKEFHETPYFQENRSRIMDFGPEGFHEEKKAYDDYYKNYVGIPTETRARLMEIRKAAYDANQKDPNAMYDPLNQKVTPETYQKLLKYDYEPAKDDYRKWQKMFTGPLEELKGIYTDEEIIKLLNTVAKNESQESNNFATQTARFGGQSNFEKVTLLNKFFR
jgi:hypothetical protein